MATTTGATMLIDSSECTKYFFFPRDSNPYADIAPGIKGRCTVKDVACANGVVCKCTMVQAEVPCGYTIIHFHGNGELVESYLEEPPPACLHQFFNSIGLTTVFFEYRGYGPNRSSRDKLAITPALEDITNLLSTFHLQEDKVIVFGRSLGSLFALKLVSKHPKIAGLILDSGVASVCSVWGEAFEGHVDVAQLKEEEARHLGQISSISAYQGPALIMQAVDDRLVPFEQNARVLFKSHAESGVASGTPVPPPTQNTSPGVTLTTSTPPSPTTQLAAFDKGDHNYIYLANVESYHSIIKDFVTTHCGVVIPATESPTSSSSTTPQSRSEGGCLLC
ncbi:prolyl oligopeptidase family serine peptidase [Pelomyxa schiedti]|nr:prolyl oligopeptidase family serine peptidase [Pelomyxa schiedti]